MKPHPNAPGASLILAALCLLCFPAFAADPAAAPAAPTPAPTAIHQGKAENDVGIIVDSGDGTHPFHHSRRGDDRVSVLGSVRVGSDEEVDGSAVAVCGSVTVNGIVDEDAVSVMGSNYINGTVHGNAVAVLGNLRLGPNARVDGDVVCVGGRYTRDASATVGGREVEKNAGPDFSEDPRLRAWVHHGLWMGRPFAMGEHLFGAVMIGLFVYSLCVLLALVFPGGVTRCGETLVQRPGITFLTGLLGVLALPVLFLLLLVTIVGIPVAVVILPLGLIACVLFGKAAIYALVGRSIVGRQAPAVIGALVGGALFVALYFIPFLGGALWLIVAFLGFACVLTTLFTYSRAAAPAVAAAAPAIPPVMPLAAAAAGAAPAEQVPPAVAAAAAVALPTALSAVEESGLPRAGFWVRMVALLIDSILVGVVTQMHHLFLPCMAVYGAILWKLRGATVGDIIFGLKVVRVDGKPSEWVTMIVRALACFFSLVVVGLGFFWIAFDPEKQGWHDKIAGTVVVKLPKGISLV
jgi:uncharacterized RDD family membrane protein YckC